MIRSFRNRVLKRFWEHGDAARLGPERQRIERLLSALDAAAEPADMDVPGFHFHALHGDREGVYSVRVTGNWRMTWEWDGIDAVRVDFEDCH